MYNSNSTNFFKEMFMKKLFVLLTVLFLFVVGTAVFAEGQQESGAAGEKTEISHWSSQWTTPEMEAYLNNFETEYPQYKLVFTHYESQDYKTQIRLAVAGGNAPDVYQSNEGFTFWEFVDRGAAMDITDIAKERGWYDRAYDEFLEADTDEDGRLYGMPFSGLYMWQVYFTNNDFFKESGLTYPETVDDMVATAPKIKSAGMQPVAWGNKDGWPSILMIGDFILQLSDPGIVDELNSGELKWTDSEVARRSIEAMAKLAQGGAFVSGYTTQDHEAGIMSWAGERAALLYNGAWWPHVTDGTDLGFDIGVIPLSKIEGGTDPKGTQFWCSLHMIINSETKVKDAAVDFMDYITAPEMHQALAADMGSYTSHPGVNENIDLNPIFTTDPFKVQLDLPKMGYADHAFPIPVIEVMKVQLAKAMSGSVTVDEALAAIEKAHAKER